MKNPGARKEFLVSSDLAEVQKTSLKILDFLKPLNLSEAVTFDVRLCLEEALINAMKYGNQLKKEIPVKVSVEHDSKALRIEIRDQGKGFDVARVQDCTQKENLLKGSGRGVFLIHRLMDKVVYNAKGNEVLMTKFLKKETANER